MEYIFDSGVTPGKFAKFVTPSVIMLMVMSAYFLIDSIFVAKFIGQNALAAMNIAYPIQGIGWGISVMIATGASALVAINMGEGKIKKARQRFTLIFIVAALVGIVIAGVAIYFLENIVLFLGATPTLFDDAMTYGRITLISFPVAFISVLMEFFIRVDGRPGFTLFIYILNAAIHLLLDILFMVVWGWGIESAALSALWGQAFVVLIGLVYFIINQVKKSNLRFTVPKLDLKFIGHTFVNGSSEMVTESSVAITTFLYNIVMLRLIGEVGVTALTIVQNTHYLLISVHLGFITGVAPLISYYYGAQAFDKVNIFLRYSKNFLIASSIGISLIAFFFATNIAGVFVDPDSQAYELATNGVRIISVAFLFTGFNVFGSGFFTAYGNGLISALISFCRGFIMVVLGLTFLPRLFGVEGVWMVIVFTEIATIGVSLMMFKTFKNKYHYTFLGFKGRLPDYNG